MTTSSEVVEVDMRINGLKVAFLVFLALTGLQGCGKKKQGSYPQKDIPGPIPRNLTLEVAHRPRWTSMVVERPQWWTGRLKKS